MRGVAAAVVLMAALAGGTLFFLASRRSSDVNRLRAQLASDVEQGGIEHLGRAQSLGRRLYVANPDDEESAAALAFTSAALALDYGFNTAPEAEAIVARMHANDSKRGRVADEPSGAASAVAASAHALCLLNAGDRKAAAREAAVAVAASPDLPQPLYALGRARALAGDLMGASRALEAAVVNAPLFSEAQVSWAEVRLEAGDAAAARDALKAILARAPGNSRAGLLLDEAEQALGAASPATLRRACPDAGALGPLVQAGCTLARALRARRAGMRKEALARLAGLAATLPNETRILSRTAEALAQMGAVDQADVLLQRARRLAAAGTPAIGWAFAAVTLGRGRATSLPTGARPADLEVRLLEARAALAAGGLGALSHALDVLGPTAVANDWDLQSLALLRTPGSDGPAPAPAGGDDALRAYVGGLRARIDGDLVGAARLFRGALSGHGDACRAAGEYVATLRALKTRADPATFTALRAENAACVNLP